MTIPDNINLGRKGRFGTVNINTLKGGIKISELENPEQIKLFNKFDKDSNGIITKDELQELINSLGSYADDGKITRKEVKKIFKENKKDG